jgi:hypothetical protein
VNSRNKWEKNGQILQNCKIEKKRKRKHWYCTESIYMCALQINYGKTCCETKGDFRQGSRDRWIQAILLVKSFKLVPRPFEEGARPNSGKLRLIWHLFRREDQLVQTKRKC